MIAKKKTNVSLSGLVGVKITGTGCWLADRQYQPGETATVPAELAQEWIEAERAILIAEAQDGK